VLAGITCAFAGLCYAEFASIIPIAGSAYTYGYATLGEFVAWIIGWDLGLEYGFGAATVASGWSGYFNSLLAADAHHIPPQLTATPGTVLVFFHQRWLPLASLPPGTDASGLQHATGLFNLVGDSGDSGHYHGSGDRHQGVGQPEHGDRHCQAGHRGHFHRSGRLLPHSPSRAGPDELAPVHSALGWARQLRLNGIATGAASIFFAYIGFDAVSTAAQEAKNPQKDMPMGILGSLAVCTILYILVSTMLTGLVNYKSLNVADPVALGIDATGVSWGSLLVKIGAVFGLATVMLVMLLGQSRVFFSMSRTACCPSGPRPFIPSSARRGFRPSPWAPWWPSCRPSCPSTGWPSW
jgi:APA family basic amino acid/polyamine antiporter